MRDSESVALVQFQSRVDLHDPQGNRVSLGRRPRQHRFQNLAADAFPLHRPHHVQL
jgi:hypothetical protein